MASASPICLMARATSTKSWLWHQRLSHLNFDTINDLAKNDLVTGLPKFKYHKEHLCPSCEQGKSKRRLTHPNQSQLSKQMLHLLHIGFGAGPISKDEAPEVIKTFLKRITVLLQSPVIIIRTDNGTEFKNQILKEYFDSVGISHQASSVRTPHKMTEVERRNRTKPDISFLHVFGALCYPKNDREDIGKLGAKDDELYDDYICGQPSDAPRTDPVAPANQNIQTPNVSTTIAESAPTPTNSSSQAPTISNTSQDVDELPKQQHVQQPDNQPQLQPEVVVDNVNNAMFDANIFKNLFAPPSISVAESSSSQYVDPSNMHTFYQQYQNNYQWTKDHPLEQVI
ncbi:retrovirus-related pol polyprotein from transposon TNT 1-94 [Tanacetum coccineum]